MDRTGFEEKYGVNEKQKVVCYTCSAERVFPDEELFVEQLIDGIQHTFDDKVKFVLRLYPEERQRLYIEKYGDDNFVFLDQPDDGFRATETRGFGNKSAIIDFVSLMKFSDVVINLGSTTTF